MVASYTPNLRVTKQGDNDNPNTWGQVVNNQVIELFEQSIAGVGEIDITGNSNIDIASTVNNGSVDDARNMVLKLTGTIGANIELIVPAVEKIYLVDAAWSGNFTVTVKPSGGGSGVVFKTGQKGWLYTNGTFIQSLVGLLAVNNLSDLSDLSAARTALGLGNIATLNAGTGLVIVGSTLTAPTASSSIVGEVRMWTTSTAPLTWLICDGSAVSRTTYVNLYNLIGVTYGAGNGTTTFNLPDFRGRMPVGVGQGDTAEGGGSGTSRALAGKGGAETHTLTTAQLATHSHGPGNLSGSNDGHVHYTVADKSATPLTLPSPVGNSLPLSTTRSIARQASYSSGAGYYLAPAPDDTFPVIAPVVPSVSPTSPAVGSVTMNTGTTADTGSNTAHNNMSPFLGINFIIHAGV